MISAATTILIGLSTIWVDFGKYFTTFALIMSSFLSVLNAWDALFNHRKLWINYTGALVKLYDIETDLKHLKVMPPEKNEEVINHLYKKYKLILDELNEDWMNMRLNSEDSKQ